MQPFDNSADVTRITFLLVNPDFIVGTNGNQDGSVLLRVRRHSVRTVNLNACVDFRTDVTPVVSAKAGVEPVVDAATGLEWVVDGKTTAVLVVDAGTDVTPVVSAKTGVC